jgi:hypothetical protein
MFRSGDAAHLIDYRPATNIDRNWTALAVRRLEADSRRSADTDLVKLPLSGPVDLYLNDESTHPTGSLKHRPLNRHQCLRCAAARLRDVRGPSSRLDRHADVRQRRAVYRHLRTDAWLGEQGIDVDPYLPVVERAWDDKVWDRA